MLRSSLLPRRCDFVARDMGRIQRALHGFGEGAQVIVVALRGIVGVIFLPVERDSATPEARRPREVSTRVTRTLRVPKSTPATMGMRIIPSEGCVPCQAVWAYISQPR